MSDNHGNTPAAWAAVAVAMLGFVVAGIGLMFNPVSMTVFWVGVALGVVAARRLRGDGQDGAQRPRSLTASTMAVATETVALRSRAERMRAPLVAIGGLAAATFALHVRDPHVSHSWGVCPLYVLTGIYCPGCGGLRAVNDLTDGHLGAAASSNLLLVLLDPGRRRAAGPVGLCLLARCRTSRWCPRCRAG